MFDTAKVQRMTTELIKFAREHDNVYIVPEFLSPEVFALCKRAKIKFRAIMLDGANQKEVFGVPILKTAEVLNKFNERTGLIVLAKESAPFIQTNFKFTINGRLMKIPAFVMESSEVLAIYDRLTVINILQQYHADGLNYFEAQDFAIRFARGLTTFLNPDTENIKIQLWDRNYFVAPKYDVTDTAIVLRGQIVHENRYTEKTLEFYRKTYPNTPIIVSTWKDELTNEFRAACKRYSVVLLENIRPEFPKSFGSINYQLENAFKGLEYVKKQFGSKFVLLTRTDQRLNKFNFLLHLRNLTLEFPALGDKLQGRILTLGTWITRKYFPFQITDFLFFGYVDDIIKIFDMPYLKDANEFKFRRAHKKMFFKIADEKLNPASFVKYDFAEHREKLRKFNITMDNFVNTDVFWMKNFYRRHIAPLDKTTLLETWWKFIKDYLIFVDTSAVGFDWTKYEDHRRYTTVTKGTDFSQWLELYRNFNVDWV